MPVLWEVYDEDQMSPERIPVTVLQAQSCHFREVSLLKPWPTGSLESTRLRFLAISAEVLLKNSQLLPANTHLPTLSLTFQATKNNLYKDIRPSLESLSRLTNLSIYSMNLPNSGDLGTLLNNNPSLKKLSLVKVTGIVGFDGCLPLVNLTRVHFNGFWAETPGMVALFRLCPNLKDFSALICPETPTEKLVLVLRDYCPRLVCIECRDYSDVHYEMTEEVVMSFIGLPIWLETFAASPPSLTDKICQGLLRHASTLTDLNLTLRECTEETPINTSRLLANCRNLLHLTITHIERDPIDWGHPKIQWFNELGNYTGINTIELRGFAQPYVEHDFCVCEPPEDPDWDGFRAFDEDWDIEPWECNCADAYGLPPCHPPEDKRFLDTIARDGWSFKEDLDEEERLWKIYLISPEARAIRDWIFELTRSSYSFYKLVVEGFVYVNKRRMPDDDD